jgi:hypothetical protein
VRLAALPFALALVIAPASAQTGDRLAALAAARDLLVAIDFDRQMEQTGMAMGNAAFEHNIVREEEKHGITMPADLKQRIRLIINEQLTMMLTDLKRTARDDAAQIYADYFSADELRRLAVLQTDPVMRKAHSVMPQMMPRLAQIGLKKASELEPAMLAKIQEAVEEWAASQKIKGSSS